LTIPDFQSLTLPLLTLLSDGNDWRVRDAIESLAEEFQLTPAERVQRIPSGKALMFDNRVAWACTHMLKAGVIERVSRGTYRVSERGRELLSTNPPRIDIALLGQYPEYRAFRRPRTRRVAPDNVDGIEPFANNAETIDDPIEALSDSYQQLRAQLAQELLDEVKASPPSFFERVVIDLLVAMGYGGSHADAAQAVGRSGDGGIDGIIKEDRLGLDAVYIQAKRWENVVGRPVVQGFAGSLEGQRARKGVMITTSEFSRGAHEYVGVIEKRIVLIDGERLAELMIDYGIGVTEVASYTIHRVDSDYFSDE
jgi:restriction system protein